MTSRLAVANRSCTSVRKLAKRLCAHEIDALFASDRTTMCISITDASVEIPFGVARSGIRLSSDCSSSTTTSTFNPLAVRGELLSLHKSRGGRDDAGNLSSTSRCSKSADDGSSGYEARFDEDDFDSAYREPTSVTTPERALAFAESGGRGNGIHSRVQLRMIWTTCSMSHRPRCAIRESITVNLPGSLNHPRVSRERRRIDRNGFVLGVPGISVMQWLSPYLVRRTVRKRGDRPGRRALRVGTHLRQRSSQRADHIVVPVRPRR